VRGASGLDLPRRYGAVNQRLATNRRDRFPPSGLFFSERIRRIISARRDFNFVALSNFEQRQAAQAFHGNRPRVGCSDCGR